ncbi:hypothetical protein OAM91_03250 [Gammaproteobacteria bacterium]|jgi:hypothetical protein|nr:hypothetical protein [Gammaproteobacteria bacterium]
MNKIQPNSLEAVILFTLYICAQDSVIADEELDQLSLELPILQKLYFDIYGEYIEEDFKKMIKNTKSIIFKEPEYTGLTISKIEMDTFNKLLTDPKIQDISLLASSHAASADGFHKNEKVKYKYWLSEWLL